MYTLKPYSRRDLTRMNTEALHRLYTRITGRSKFNPYAERENMVMEIFGAIERIVYSACFRVAEMVDITNEVLAAIGAQRKRMAKEARNKVSDFLVKLIRLAHLEGVSANYLSKILNLSTKLIRGIMLYQCYQYV